MQPPEPCQPGLFRRLILRTNPESTKRAVMVWTCWTLASVVLGIGGCIGYRIVKSGDVGTGAVAAFGAVTVPLAGLAGVGYRKPEAPQVTP